MKYIILIFLFFCFQMSSYAQCPGSSTNILTFRSQVDVDNFMINYPNCTDLQVGIRIESHVTSNIITNLDGFSNLVRIRHGLFIERLTDVTGSGYVSSTPFSNLQRIDGSFIMASDSGLFFTNRFNDYSGFQNLTYVGGDLELKTPTQGNYSAFNNLSFVGGNVVLSLSSSTHSTSALFDWDPNIINHSGNIRLGSSGGFSTNTLSSLTHINGDLTLGGTTSINAVHNLQSVGGKLTLGSFTSISDFQSLTTVGGVLELAFLNTSDFNFVSNLTSVGSLFIHDCNNVVDFAGLSNIVGNLTSFQVNDMLNLLSFSGLSNINSITDRFDVYENPSLMSFDGFDNLSSLSGVIEIENNSNLVSFDGFENVTDLNGDFSLRRNHSLYDISSLDNVINSGLTELEIRYNNLLSYCSVKPICDYVATSGNTIIDRNGIGCNNEEEVQWNCDLKFGNLIFGTVTYDLSNQGSCGMMNSFTANAAIEVTKANTSQRYYTSTDSNGNYQILVPEEGDYTVRFYNNMNNYYISSPIQTIVNFVGIGNQSVANFCAYSQITIDDMSIELIPLDEPRPGFTVDYLIQYENLGTSTLTDVITYNFDPNIMTFVSSSVPPSSLVNGEAVFNYSLSPLSNGVIRLVMRIEAPPVVQLGNILTTTATINAGIGDVETDNNLAVLNEVVIGSYDPNDKMAVQGESILNTELDKYLDYRIRFENTGTASAINVLVVDSLNTFRYDVNSMRLTGSSHDVRMRRKNGIVSLEFDNINLPDNITDPQGAQGFVTFKVKPRSYLPVGQIIKNKSYIFFDYNPPIITNEFEIFIDGDEDNDGIGDSIDICQTVYNPNQLDGDNNGIGDACEPDLGVNALFEANFNTIELDNLWTTYGNGVSTSSSDDPTGRTVRISDYNSNPTNDPLNYTAIISPRLLGLNATNFSISINAKKLNSGIAVLIAGFLTDRNDMSTLTEIDTHYLTTNMTEYFIDLSNYVPAMGNYIVFAADDDRIALDNFVFNNTLSIYDYSVDDFSAYPNPFHEKFSLNHNYNFELLSVYDLTGKLLKTLSHNNDNSYEITELHSGIYIAKINYQNGEDVVVKLIKK